MNKVCEYCDQAIETPEEEIMCGMDRPYANLWFHRVCWNILGDDLNDFLHKNVNKWYNNYRMRIENNGKRIRNKRE